MSKPTFKKLTVPTILKWLGNYRYFSANEGEEAPLKTMVEAGKGKKPFWILTGENATGKSFFTFFVACIANGIRIEPIRISMRERTEADMMRCFKYMDEGHFSTGHSSTHSIQGGLRTSRERDIQHVLLLDEPDVGLSESYQHAVGAFIGEFMADPPENCVGILLTTHSKTLVRALRAKYPGIHHLRFGDTMKLDEWLKTPYTPLPPEALDDLQERGGKCFKEINRIKG